MNTVKLISIAVVLLTASVAHADPGVARDDLLPRVEPPASVVVQPRSNIDMLAATKENRHDRLWQAIDVTALVVSTAALAWDWKQTRTWAGDNWQRSDGNGGMWVNHENNPIIGARPGMHTVDVYFALTAATNLAIWYLMPEKYRSVVPAALVVAEASAIAGNIRAARRASTGSWSCSMCGF